MPVPPRGTPTSYDEILRRTVPETDLSQRPSREEQALSRHRFGEATEHAPHPLTPQERLLLDRVTHEVAGDPTLDLSAVEIEIDHRIIIFTGSVPGPATSVRIEERAAAVHGVEAVDNQLVVRSRH